MDHWHPKGICWSIRACLGSSVGSFRSSLDAACHLAGGCTTSPLWCSTPCSARPDGSPCHRHPQPIGENSASLASSCVGSVLVVGGNSVRLGGLVLPPGNSQTSGNVRLFFYTRSSQNRRFAQLRCGMFAWAYHASRHTKRELGRPDIYQIVLQG